MMKNKAIFKIALHNVFYDKKYVGIFLLNCVLMFSIILFFCNYASSLEGTMEYLLNNEEENRAIMVSGGMSNSERDYPILPEELAKYEEIQKYNCVTVGVTNCQDNIKINNINLPERKYSVNIEFLRDKELQERELVIGRLPENNKEAVIMTGSLDYFNLLYENVINSQLSFAKDAKQEYIFRDIKITGVAQMDNIEGIYLIMTEDSKDDYLNTSILIFPFVLIYANSYPEKLLLMQDLQNDFPKCMVTDANSDKTKSLNNIQAHINVVKSIFIAIGVPIVTASLLGIGVSIYSNTYRQKNLYGLNYTLGMTPKNIFALIFLQNLVMTIIAVLISIIFDVVFIYCAKIIVELIFQVNLMVSWTSSVLMFGGIVVFATMLSIIYALIVKQMLVKRKAYVLIKEGN